ncbi:MAG TPA: TRAP transporter large permease subunit [Conexibacter sp.]|jgi:C4-dicarboxylate transporter DctM subunit
MSTAEPLLGKEGGRPAVLLARVGSATRVARVVTLALTGAAMVALVLVVLYEIVGRELLSGGAAPWTNEISTYLLVWIVFLGAGLAVTDRSEPAVELFVSRLPRRVAREVNDVADAVSVFLFVYLLVYGIQLINLVGSEHSPASGISLAWVVAAVPVGAALMLFFKLSLLLSRLRLRPLLLAAAAVALGLFVAGHSFQLSEGWFYIATLGILALCLLVGVPIGESMLAGAVLGLGLTSPFTANVAYVQGLVSGLENFTFVAIPLFLLTGALVAHTGAATRLASFSRSLVGWLPGGLAVADVGASAVFADISGSAVADTVALSSSMIPELEREGYPREFAAGLQASAGTLGVLFPPSISTLIYASVASVSVGAMFAALLIPGLLVAFSFAVTASLLCWRKGWGVRTGFSVKTVGTSGMSAAPALFTVVVVLGGIFSGLFTATEAGAVAVTYIMVAGVLGYRTGGQRFALDALVDAVRNTGRVGFIIGAALAFGEAMVANSGPQDLVNAIGGISSNPTVVMLLLLAGLVFVSTVLEPSTTPLVVVPVLLPLLNSVGVDLIKFGVLMQIDAAMALLLPPIGLCLFLVSSTVNVTVEQTAKWAAPFIFALFVDLLLVLFIGPLTGWLPTVLTL